MKKQIHHWVVKEFPSRKEPISLSDIADRFKQDLKTVETIITELENDKTFLYRNRSKGINWAYPVTLDTTPHEVSFSSGETVHAAWAIDAIAIPFVQGKLRKENLDFTIRSTCSQSQRPITIVINSNLDVLKIEEGANPYIFVPMIDSETIEEASIIEIFWQLSVFFWSEDEIKAHRSENKGITGAYFTLEQAIAVTPIAQGALFGFPS